MVLQNRIQGPHFPLLGNLTFNEVQTQFGNSVKPLNNMNLDVLIKTMAPFEGGQFLQNPNSLFSFGDFNFNLNLDGALVRRTISEVWNEITDQNVVKPVDNQLFQQQQSTLGQTTLNSFLLHAGIGNAGIQDGINNNQPLMGIDPVVGVQEETDWLHYQMDSVQPQQQPLLTDFNSNFHVLESVFQSPVVNVDVGCSESQLTMPMPIQAPPAVATSSESSVSIDRKRHLPDEIMEKSIERRKKRMIKNRESAARSRARKQAYTNRLEQEVLQLEKANGQLKKQKVPSTSSRPRWLAVLVLLFCSFEPIFREGEMLLGLDATPTPKYQLRRTSSALS
ncbi:Basic-leucine zipper domain [Dillenia turbinata]|uniref:Basic-leucine zipper domain n=1 Tax=Dillenia turbinata TaxID=194707 RepID=A0AAN8VQK7_9MAGN